MRWYVIIGWDSGRVHKRVVSNNNLKTTWYNFFIKSTNWTNLQSLISRIGLITRIRFCWGGTVVGVLCASFGCGGYAGVATHGRDRGLCVVGRLRQCWGGTVVGQWWDSGGTVVGGNWGRPLGDGLFRVGGPTLRR